MSEFNGKFPVLGEQAKMRAAPPTFASLVRHMEEDGTFTPESTQLANGQIQAVAGRSNICSAEDLTDMIVDALIHRLKVLIREELAYQKTLDT